ncbi:MAG: type IV conjugative transfer system protein TraE [Chlamydiales bacterium]
MNRPVLEKSLHFLEFQRNILVTISLLMAIGVIILSSFLFLKRERIIIAPPVIEKEFWVDSHHVSPSYLEQLGLFLGQLLLGKSSQSAPSQRSILLRHADPSFVGMLKQRLIEEEEILKKQNAAYVFYPMDVKVDSSQMSLTLLGDRLLFVAGKQVSSEREEYTLYFSLLGSKMLLKGITSNSKKG